MNNIQFDYGNTNCTCETERKGWVCSRCNKSNSPDLKTCDCTSTPKYIDWQILPYYPPTTTVPRIVINPPTIIIQQPITITGTIQGTAIDSLDLRMIGNNIV